MSCPLSAIAAIVHDDDDKTIDEVLADFARALAERGIPVRGLVQRNTPNPKGGHRHMDLIDLRDGTTIRISQDLGPGAGSCHLDVSAITSASAALRRAVAEGAPLAVVNRFGAEEVAGRGFADEMLALMSEGIPLLTAVAERHKADWLRFTGGASTLLPLSRRALDDWFAGLGQASRPLQGPKGTTLLEAAVGHVRDRLGRQLDGLVVERAVAGLTFTGVKLNNGTAGTSYTPARPVIRSVDCGALPKAIRLAGGLKGRPASDFLDDLWEDLDGCRALGVSVLNALAETCWRLWPDPDWNVQTGLDGLDALEVEPGEHVVMVGAFTAYIDRLRRSNASFEVLELSTAPFMPDEMPYYRPAQDASEVIPNADALLITGSTMVNGTIDGLLASAAPHTRIALVGPSTPLLPTVLATRQIAVPATIRITDPDRFLDILAEGGGAQCGFDGSAEIVVLRRSRGPGGESGR